MVPVEPARLRGASTHPVDAPAGWKPAPLNPSAHADGPIVAAAPVTPAGPVLPGMSAAQLDWAISYRREVVTQGPGEDGFLPAILASVGGRFDVGGVAVDDVTTLRAILAERLQAIAASDPALIGRRPSGPSSTEHGAEVGKDATAFLRWRAGTVRAIYTALYHERPPATQPRSGEISGTAEERIDNGTAFKDIIRSVQEPRYWPELARQVVPYFLNELGPAVRVVDSGGNIHRYGAGRPAYVAQLQDTEQGTVSWAALPPRATLNPDGRALGQPNRSDPILVRLGQAIDARRPALTDAEASDPVVERLSRLAAQWQTAATPAAATETSAAGWSADWLTTTVDGLTPLPDPVGQADGRAVNLVQAGLSLGSAVELAGKLFPPERGGIRSASGSEQSGGAAKKLPGIAAEQWIVMPSLRDLLSVVPHDGAALFLRGRQAWVVVDTEDGRREVKFDPDTRRGQVTTPDIMATATEEDPPGLALIIDASGQVQPAGELRNNRFASAAGWSASPPFGRIIPGHLTQDRTGTGTPRFSPDQEAWASTHQATLGRLVPGDDAFFEAAAHAGLTVGGTRVSTAADLRKALADYLWASLSRAKSANEASLLSSAFRFHADQRQLEENGYNWKALNHDALHVMMSNHLQSGEAVRFTATAIETPGYWEQVTQQLAPHLLAESAGVHLLVLEPDGQVRGYGDRSKPRLVLARADTGMTGRAWASVRSNKSGTDARTFDDIIADTAISLPVTKPVTEHGGTPATLIKGQQEWADRKGLQVQPTRAGRDSIYSAILAAAGGVLHLDAETVVHSAEGLRRGLAGLVRARPDVLESGDPEEVVKGLITATLDDTRARIVAARYLGIKITTRESDVRDLTYGRGHEIHIAPAQEKEGQGHWAALTPRPNPLRYADTFNKPRTATADLPTTSRPNDEREYRIDTRGNRQPDGWTQASQCATILVNGKWVDACVSVAVIEVSLHARMNPA